MKKMFVLAIALLVICSPAFAANMLTNGDFETGTTAGWTDWSNGYGNKTQGVKTTDTYNGGTDAHGGTYAWYCYCKSSYSGGIYQQVTVTPGVQYILDGWWKAVSDSSGVYWYEVGMINGPWNFSLVDGGTTTTIWKQTVQTLPDPNTDPKAYVQWSTQSFLPGGLGSNIITASGSTITVWVKIGQGAVSPKSRVRVDDITLDIVPEPGSLLVLGVGLTGLAAAIRRRR